MILLTQRDNTIRAYLDVSDYNFWGDILQVTIILKDTDAEKARFVFKQYEHIGS